MRRERVARQYSKALFTMAGDNEHLRAMVGDLRAFAELLAKTPQFLRFLDNPQIEIEQKEEVLLEALGAKRDPLITSMLSLMLERGRIAYAVPLAQVFADLVDEHLGILEVQVTTATPLDASTKKQLQERLAQTYHKMIEFIEKVDPKLIGGAVVMLGTHMIDSSVKDRLASLKESLISMRI